MTEERRMMPNTTPERRKTRARPPRTTPRKWTDKLDRNHLSADEKSSDGSAATTPSSVMINGYPMVKDLSDLSGSYLNGNTAPRAGPGYPSDGESDTSYNRPWLLAKILSSREPVHPQPPPDSNDSVVKTGILVIDNCGQLEVVPDDALRSISNAADAATSTSSGSFQNNADGDCSSRIPLLLLLMDPGRKMYELLQLWIDVHQDSVRDVLHALQMSLKESWRQDYDGIFQVRNNHFSQLIHILPVEKYEPRPYELWVAKPWSMSAKHTVGYASGVLNHLKTTGVLEYSMKEQQPLQLPQQKQQGAQSSSSKATKHSEDPSSALVLSPEAIARSYVPGGVLKHYHAYQFLSFSPPFEAPAIRVDVLGGAAGSSTCTDDVHSLLGSDGVSAAASDAGKPQQQLGDSAAEDRRVFDIPPVVKQERGVFRKIARLLTALNCTGRRRRRRRRQRKQSQDPSDTMLMSDTTMLMESAGVGESLWRLMEDVPAGADRSVASSVVSETAPLLLASPSSSRSAVRKVYAQEI